MVVLERLWQKRLCSFTMLSLATVFSKCYWKENTSTTKLVKGHKILELSYFTDEIETI